MMSFETKTQPSRTHPVAIRSFTQKNISLQCQLSKSEDSGKIAQLMTMEKMNQWIPKFFMLFGGSEWLS